MSKNSQYDLWMQQEAFKHEKEMFLLKNCLKKNSSGVYDRIPLHTNDAQNGSSAREPSRRSLFGSRRKKR